MKASLSRRKFIQSGALITAAGAASGTARCFAEAVPASGKPLPLQIGLASYTFRDFARAQLIGFMKQLNVTKLNAKDVKDHLPTDPAAEAQALADYAAAGVKLHAAGVIYFPIGDESDIRGKFEYCKRAGIDLIIAGDPTADALKGIEKCVKEYDIRFAIHNHGPKDKLYPSPFDVRKAINDLDPRIGYCIDIGHTARAGTNVVEAIHAVAPRLYNLHFKDLRAFQGSGIEATIGDGIMPIREIFEALIAIGYKGFVDLEYESHPDDPMPGVIASFSYMRGVLAGMGYLSHA